MCCASSSLLVRTVHGKPSSIRVTTLYIQSQKFEDLVNLLPNFHKLGMLDTIELFFIVNKSCENIYVNVMVTVELRGY